MGRHSRKTLIVMFSGLLATSMLAALPAAASAVEGPDLSSGLATSEAPVTKKTVTVYDGDESKKQDFDCLFRDDMPNVPYVDVEQYLELVFNDTDFVMTQSGDQFSYHGEIGDKKGSNLTIDTAKDTASFDKPRSFLVGKQNDLDADYIKIVPEKVEEEKELLYSLADYGIDLLAEGGRAYVPLSTISDINFQSYSWPDYVDGSIYLARYGSTGSSDFIAKKESELFDTVERPADVAEYAYNELCFQIDELYGKPGQARSKELVKRIESEGFDKALNEGGIVDDINLTDMQKYLKSTNIGEYGAGILMLHALLVDGGHSQWGTPFAMQISNDPEMNQTEFAKEYKKLCEKDPTVAGLVDLIKPLDTQKFVLQADLIELRDKSFGKAEKSWLGDDGEEHVWLYIFDNTAVFRFDHFDDQVIKTTSGAHPFNEALAAAKEKGCKNFVIDLSTNTGGSDDTMGFILSSIENKNANAYHIDAKTKYRMKDTFYADKNLDGVIDEKDEEVKYDFNYAIMTSRVSYSNGNALPARASEAGIPTLGERSGGGGCSLSFFVLPGASNKYCISGTYSLTYSNYESIDPGVPADYEMLEINDDGTIKSADFYDPTKLVATMNQHYAKKDIASCTVTGIEAKTYNGEEQTQAITVKDGQATLAEGADYTVSYRDNVNAGTATATIEGKGAYAGSVDKAFKIKKAENPMTVKGKTVTASASKKSTFKKAQAFKVSDAEGKVTFRKDKGNAKITVGKTGKVTVKKGLKAGKTYKVKVKVTAAGNENYNKATKAATVKVKVK